MTERRRAALDWLLTPFDGAGLAAFRIAFGLLMTGSALRFLAKGWVTELYVAPRHHFTFFGFEWVKPWPEPFMTLHVVALAVLAFCVALGFLTRVAAGLYFLLFTYAELIEKSAYLNHYYLVSLLALLIAVLPTHAVASLDARFGLTRRLVVRRFHYAALRAQIAIVYVYAGLAKLNGDWLFRAEPLHTWLRAHTGLPVVGRYLSERWVAFGMSYFGLLFDLSIVWFVSRPRTRKFAWICAILFHGSIAYLFPVGVFSWVMLIALSSFGDPSWPRRLLALSRDRLGLGARTQVVDASPSSPTTSFPTRALLAFLGVHLLVQIALPARFLLYPGPVNWTEEGFRFSWRVMLIEKAGQAEFTVRTDDPPTINLVFPRDELTPLQARMMSTQADMIHDYALHLAAIFREKSGRPVHVTVDSWVAFNGRPSQRFIDPHIDLAAQPRTLGHAPWILPLVSEPAY